MATSAAAPAVTFEADAITFLALRQIGCKIATSVGSISQLSSDDFVEVIARALNIILAEDLYPSPVLSKNIASRHRTCTDIANRVKSLGFPSECGYNQILYPVEAQARSLLNWLVQILPRTKEETTDFAVGANEILNHKIREAISSWKGKLGSVRTMTPFRTSLRPPSSSSSSSSSARRFSMQSQPVVPSILENNVLNLLTDSLFDTEDQEYESVKGAGNTLSARAVAAIGSFRKETLAPSSSSGASSLVEILRNISSSSNQQGGGDSTKTNTRFSNASTFSTSIKGSLGVATSADEDQEVLAGQRQKANRDWVSEVNAEDEEARATRVAQERAARTQELDQLQSDILSCSEKLAALEKLHTTQQTNLRFVENDITVLTARNSAQEEQLILLKQTLQLLPEATQKIEELRQVCSSGATRIIQLSSEWEMIRRPRIEQLRSLTAAIANRQSRGVAIAKEVKKIREEISKTTLEIKERKDRVSLLDQEVSTLPADVDRASYTNRIMEITLDYSNSCKEVDKVTASIRDIQKSVNLSTNALLRADSVCEELIYSAAKNSTGASSSQQGDAVIKSAYRSLGSLRSSFDDLIAAIEEVVRQEKLFRDLETKIDQEASRLSANNLDKITEDLVEVQKENQRISEMLQR